MTLLKNLGKGNIGPLLFFKALNPELAFRHDCCKAFYLGTISFRPITSLKDQP